MGVSLCVSSYLGPFEPLPSEPKEKACQTCQSPLTVYYVVVHDVQALSGKRPVTEIIPRCQLHLRQVFRPPPLTPPKSPSAFDVVADAGRLGLLEKRRFVEITDRLPGRSLSRLPPRTALHLTDQFLRYHAAVLLGSLPRLREALRRRAGNVLVLERERRGWEHNPGAHRR